MEFVEGTPFFLGDYLNASLYEWSMGAGQLRHGYLIEFIQKDACRESSILLLFHRNTLSNETDKKKKKTWHDLKFINQINKAPAAPEHDIQFHCLLLYRQTFWGRMQFFGGNRFRPGIHVRKFAKLPCGNSGGTACLRSGEQVRVTSLVFFFFCRCTIWSFTPWVRVYIEMRKQGPKWSPCVRAVNGGKVPVIVANVKKLCPLPDK